MRPFYEQAKETLRHLLAEQTIEPIFDRVCEAYKEVTLENTMKLLIRCKMTYSSRHMVLELFDFYRDYEREVSGLKEIIDKQMTYKID